MITYTPKFIADPDLALKTLQEELNWVRRETTPRSEYYINAAQVPYTYGSGRGVRTYEPQPIHPLVADITKQLEALTGTKFEVCFLNRYHDQSDHLGWHADDSPEMDDSRPIAIISLGAEREIWFCPQNDKTQVTKQKLEHGSLCLMPAGMQDTHFHRIPKAGFLCGERISLTFRGYVQLGN
jgi:alkylated DNA repair dioxygenase AlkB